MRKICVIITARTSLTKLKPILKAIKDHNKLQLQIICAASALLERYGKVDESLVAEGYTVDRKIYMMVEGENLVTSAKSTGLGIVEFTTAFDAMKPDVVLVMADRFEIMAPAIAASYMNIPLAHAQGGEVSGNIDEKVRHAVTKLADIHFPATKQAAEWIIRMGEDEGSVFHTGCPSIDIASAIIKEDSKNIDVYKKYGGVGACPDLNKGYVIVMQHPTTTEFGYNRGQADETLKAIKDLEYPALWFWPNADAGSEETSKAIRSYREKYKLEHIHFFKNMQPEDFLRLLNNSLVIIGNSSVGIREASFLGVPAVNIGTRQNNRERGPNVIDVDYYEKEISEVIKKQIKGGRKKSSDIYGKGDAGKKIAEILASIELKSTKSLSYTSTRQTSRIYA